MRNENDKYIIEKSVLISFSESSGLDIDLQSIYKGDPNLGEPDLFCSLEGESIYFELADCCPTEFAAAIAKSNGKGFASAYSGDGITEILRKKLKKVYKVEEPIDLLLYENGRNSLPDKILTENAL